MSMQLKITLEEGAQENSKIDSLTHRGLFYREIKFEIALKWQSKKSLTQLDGSRSIWQRPANDSTTVWNWL